MLQRAGKKEGGVLTQAEFTKHLPRFGGQPVRPGGNAFVKGLIMRLDRDGDGKLSKAEVPAQMKENFSRRDRNNDGTLDESELANIFRSAPGKTRPKSKRPPAPKKK
jgi:Ca2+-binding EF-hand superfamily protein